MKLGAISKANFSVHNNSEYSFWLINETNISGDVKSMARKLQLIRMPAITGFLKECNSCILSAAVHNEPGIFQGAVKK